MQTYLQVLILLYPVLLVLCRRGIHSERQVILSDFSDTDLPIVIHSRGWRSLCDIPITCPSVIIQEFYSNMHGINTSMHGIDTPIGMRIAITPDIVSKVILIPRVAHPDYPTCAQLMTVSKDELLSLFCETLSSWGDRQNTPCSDFVKGLRFLNMVITFILHPKSPHFSVMCAIDAATFRRSEAELRPKQPWTETATPPASTAPSTFSPSPSAGGVILEAIMAQLVRMDARLDTLSDELC